MTCKGRFFFFGGGVFFVRLCDVKIACKAVADHLLYLKPRAFRRCQAVRKETSTNTNYCFKNFFISTDEQYSQKGLEGLVKFSLRVRHVG